MKMKEKISRNELKRKVESIKGLVDDIINEKINIPDNALVVDFDATLNVFTKKRMELIDNINIYAPTSIQELANISDRTKQAVYRDLKILKRFDVIKLEKHGKFTIPIVKREMIILNFRKPKLRKEEAIFADVYFNDRPISKFIGAPL